MNVSTTVISKNIVSDWRRFETTRHIEAVSHDGDAVHLVWSDDRRTAYARFWLRDNCTCAQCYLPLTREQVFEIVDAPADLAPMETRLGSEGHLHVRWSDGHASQYAPGWLRAHAPDDESRAERRELAPKPFIWGAEHADELKTFSYDVIMQDDHALRDWLRALRDSGLTRLTGVPTAPGSLLGPAQRISHIRETNFGRIFDVKSKPAPDSAAYTSVNLPPHTDLPTRELQPGLQFLHCLINDATGGESIFVDGFAIARAMQKERPECFRVITSTPMAFWNRDDRTDYRWSAPVIALGLDGEVDEVRFANFLRGPMDAPAEQMAEIYDALRLFQFMTREARFRIERRLAPGDMWVFDNRRVMHARREFDAMSGARHLQGVYVDRDELNSRLRVLERILA